MKIPSKKLKNGFKIPELWLGTWKMWWTTTRNYDNDDARDIDALKYGISLWYTNIDTAEMYAGWYSETLLWEAIKNTPREELFLSSKVRGDNCSYKAIKNACMNSLKRLWVEYLDLYYIHWRVSQFSLKECMRAMNELVDEGYIRYIWVSNFSTESLIEAQRHSQYPIVANQVHYNLRCREPELSWLLEHCQKNDVMLVAWRPFEYWDFISGENRDIFEKLEEKYNATPFQIALSWLMSQENVVTLFKSSTPENLESNMWALWLKLNKNDHEILSISFAWQISVSDAVPLA